jgi:hypothetical protein
MAQRYAKNTFFIANKQVFTHIKFEFNTNLDGFIHFYLHR